MHTIDSRTNTSTEKIISVEVWKQFHGFTGTYDLLAMWCIICVVEIYSLEVMVTNENLRWKQINAHNT